MAGNRPLAFNTPGHAPVAADPPMTWLHLTRRADGVPCVITVQNTALWAVNPVHQGATLRQHGRDLHAALLRHLPDETFAELRRLMVEGPG